MTVDRVDRRKRVPHQDAHRIVYAASTTPMAQCEPLGGRLVWANAALERLLGLRSAALLEHDVRTFMHADDRLANEAAFSAVSRGEQSELLTEQRLIRSDGSEVWVTMKLTLVRDVDGQPARLVAIFEDISRFKAVAQSHLDDMTARRKDDDVLRLISEALVVRVSERTEALAAANASLRSEVTERRAAEQHAHELMGQLVNAEEDERRRLSRDMHDTLGQHLTALALGLMTIGQDAALPAGFHSRIVGLQQAVGEIDVEIERLAHELRPSALDDLGLADALLRHAQGWSAQTGVPVDVLTEGLDGHRLPAAAESAIYRVVQEALTNVRKHASASRVGVIVEHRAGEIRAIVEDDGRGFEPTRAAQSTEGTRGLGLRGMAERALLCGGRLEVESVPGRGTTVYLTIPLRPGAMSPVQDS